HHFRRMFGDDAMLPDYFVTAQTLSPADHLAVQAAAQKFVDSSISKTINCPEGISFEAFKHVYQTAYDEGCKGCTTYRPNAVTGAVLQRVREAADEPVEPSPEVAPASDATARQLPVTAPLGGVVYMTQPLDRPGDLSGRTYKVRWPDLDHAFY